MEVSNYIERNEFKQYAQRMEDEHDRQNHRLLEVENSLKQYHGLTLAVEKLAVNMEQMLNEQKAQSERLEALEAHDGEMWRKVTSYFVTAILGIVIGYIFKNIGM